MQLGETQKGFSRKSKLFDSLKFYLDNKDRLQPIIGLGSIIECVKADTYNSEALYMCEVCICLLNKADMRNHIMGSLHRYNYIKTWHPHLVSRWKENSDISQLAWPLMDLAKMLEREEGPGDVQLLEVEDEVYQKMTTYCENDAITLIGSLRDGQGTGEPESYPEAAAVHFDHCPSQSQRIVLLAQNQWKRSEKSSKADMTSHLLQSTVAPPFKSDGWLKNISTSEFDNTKVLSEPSLLSGSSSCFLDGYTGTKPLIGLFRVVECRGEDGCTYCFLCHCCRVRSNKKDIIDHLSSSSHVINYLMETHPEQMEAMMVAVNDNSEFLQSLAEKVEQEEGRGELKVVTAPKSLCIQLTGKSYHWCEYGIKMLCNGNAETNSQQKKVAVKGPSVNTTSVQGMPEKHDNWAKKMTTRRKKRRVTNTLFKVSLPLTKGAVLLERTSFSEDKLPVSCVHLPSANQHHIPSPESEDFELDRDSGSFAVNRTECTSMCETAQVQQDLYSEDGGIGQYAGPEGNLTVTLHQEVDGCDCDNEYFSQSEDVTGTGDQKAYADRNYNRQCGSQEGPRTNFNKDLEAEGLQTQNEGLSPAVSHTQDWTSYRSSYKGNEVYAEQWYNAASLSKTGTGAEVSNEEGQKEMSSDAAQHHYQRQPQYMAQDHASVVPGSVGHSCLSGELVPHLDAVRVSMYPYLGDCHAHSASTGPAPRTQVHEIEQRQLQTYMVPNVPITPQSYITQPMMCQAVQGVMGDPYYNIRPNNYQPFPHPVNGGNGVGAMFQSNFYIPPRQAPYHGAHPDVNFRASALSGLMFSGSDNGIVQFMHCNSQFEFCV